MKGKVAVKSMDQKTKNHSSPFHQGELQIQQHMGVREKIETYASRVIRDHLPEQHRKFYERLPFILLSTTDDLARPWASLLTGQPGFITSPDNTTLNIQAKPLTGAPLNEILKQGADIGLLGIELETRRRNRITGRITTTQSDGFTIKVNQTFGNCPKFIQTRTVNILPKTNQLETQKPVHKSDHFDKKTKKIIARSDTFFIASAYRDDETLVSQGADVSHRGGKPGFVKIEDEKTFIFPDFSGNNHFNTIGNIHLNPKAGFLFLDFDKGDMVYLTGNTEILWDDAEKQAFTGAERLIRFHVSEAIRVQESLPLKFNFNEYSPTLKHTGNWSEMTKMLAIEKSA